MPESLSEDDWETLIDRIDDGLCTPFLGAGASTVGTGADLARKWAADYGLNKDSDDLAKVAQYVGIRRNDMMIPKDEIIKIVNAAKPPLSTQDEPHGVLARLPIKVFLTTNFDDFLMQALALNGQKHPERHVCRWNTYLRQSQRVPTVPRDFEPDQDRPLIFHLHGHTGIRQSLVLTEDDYLDFLVSATTDKKLLPWQVREALMGSSLVFIGYRLSDWSFRVIFRGLIRSLEESLESLHIAVQLPPDDKLERQYLDSRFAKQNIHVYWGKANTFAQELRERWERRNAR